jgi:hypothetical protein
MTVNISFVAAVALKIHILQPHIDYLSQLLQAINELGSMTKSVRLKFIVLV